jgi:hypothetical protein
VLYCNVILHSLAGDTNISEECTASTLKVEEYAQQEARRKQSTGTLQL